MAAEFNSVAAEQRKQCVRKLRDSVLKKMVLTNPKLKKATEQKVMEMIADFRIPDHPPYAYMILEAIEKLNTKGGSDKKSISMCIKTEYKDLPLAHESILKSHIQKLCEKGDIFITRCGQYKMFPRDSNQEEEEKYDTGRSWEKGGMQTRGAKENGHTHTGMVRQRECSRNPQDHNLQKPNKLPRSANNDLVIREFGQQRPPKASATVNLSHHSPTSSSETESVDDIQNSAQMHPHDLDNKNSKPKKIKITFNGRPISEL